MTRDFAITLLLIAAVCLLIICIKENEVPVAPVVHARLVSSDQIPLVAPCITPPPGPRHIPKREA